MPRRFPLLPLAAVLLAVLVRAGPASAADEVWVETEPMETRQAAAELAANAALTQGDQRSSRVLRRFVKGEGWRYLVRIDGIQDEDEGRRIAALLAGTGTAASVVARDGDEVHTVDELAAPPTAATAPLPAAGAALDRLPDARTVLRDAVRAHGGLKGGQAVLELARSVELDVERTVAIDKGALVAANRYYRQGDALRLEVEVVQGTGTDSVTVLTADNHAWVTTGGETVGRDAARTREVLARFSPEGVLAVPLGLAQDVEDAADWQDLKVVAREDLDGAAQLRLASTTPARGNDGLVAAWFDVSTGTLSAVDWRTSAGVIGFRYKDYRSVAEGLIIPFEATIRRDGTQVEQVRVLRLTLDPALDPALFAAPVNP